VPDVVPLKFAIPVAVDVTPSVISSLNVGLFEKTSEPVPVSSVTAAARLADEGVPKNVRMPVPVVVVEGATPAPPPITRALAVRAAEDARVPVAL